MPVIPRDPRLVDRRHKYPQYMLLCSPAMPHVSQEGISWVYIVCVDRPHDIAFLRPNVCTAGKTSRLASLGMAPLYGPPFDIVCVERTCSLPIRHVKVDPRRATNHSAASGAESQDDVPGPCPRRQCTLRCSPSANRIPVVHCIRKMAPRSLTFPPARTSGPTHPWRAACPLQ
jgi:hypothetical protein